MTATILNPSAVPLGCFRRGLLLTAVGLLFGALHLLPRVLEALPMPSGTASIRGTVRDQAGAALPGAHVKVLNQQSGMPWEATANPDGSFLMFHLEPGVYAIEAKFPGFYKFQKNDVHLRAGQDLKLQIKLQLFQRPGLLAKVTNPNTMVVERHADSQFEQSLIDKAERLPCPGDNRLNRLGSSASGWPNCLNRSVVDVYSQLILDHKNERAGDLTALPDYSKGYYGVTATYESTRQCWKVELILQYSHTCGNLCGESFEIIRRIYFDEHMTVLGIEGDDEGAHGWIS